MLDYKLLQALAAVVDHSGFERGARHLGLTQSAVSQRIKLLEARLGQPVLIRTPKLSPTPLGQRLLNHVQQVHLLEHDLLEQIPALGEREQRLRLAINADSLATWWAPVTGDFCRRRDVLLDLVVEDQDVALRRMRDGEVAGCICATPRPVQGARAQPLGSMRYRALASPGYVERHFPQGLTVEALRRAPAIVYGPDDRLQHRYLEMRDYLAPFPHHLCPSSEGFIHLALAGMGYGLIPERQVTRELREGTLVDLDAECFIDVPLHWHYWRQGGKTLEALTDHLLASCPQWLTPLADPAHSASRPAETDEPRA
ncbi:LysR family transcriptional regulator, chromosome initiation inhibitor [Modicisalibacter ilicicola DSM 19980]|uniref:LysR family transcriptional regulator, chromosome initiation inhibitor n=1 Tax=Modicisalibacter ilicicola DSM 19980 TaxID=1121942 RepID=A0A1M5BX09_9GAMM|nr:LysR family transcriptional regulator ArgP [Halomonas ilicicola]SHF47054.1 LysR family transcriptional regulator, chromosome initiation inhibitor [Halomonas ilicicola DSM 19980]